ncbi:hypothetical protein ACPA9J_23590 [Pseudomonas aeruginosa]
MSDLSLKRVKTLPERQRPSRRSPRFVDPKNPAADPRQEEALILPSPISSSRRRCVWVAGPACWVPWSTTRNCQAEPRAHLESGLRCAGYQAPLGIRQDVMLAGAVYGNRYEEHWTLAKETVDFYDLKGDLESVLDLTGKLAGHRVPWRS